MNKFIKFLTLAYLVSLAKSSFKSQSDIDIYNSCVPIINEDFKCDNNNECGKGKDETNQCISSKKCLDQDNFTYVKLIAKCISDCNKSSNDLVKTHFTKVTECLNEEPISGEENLELQECKSQYGRLDCEDDVSCVLAFKQVGECMEQQQWNKLKTTESIAKCMRNCNNSHHDKVESFYDDYANCLDGTSSANILNFATLLFSIFFMLF